MFEHAEGDVESLRMTAQTMLILGLPAVRSGKRSGVVARCI